MREEWNLPAPPVWDCTAAAIRRIEGSLANPDKDRLCPSCSLSFLFDRRAPFCRFKLAAMTQQEIRYTRHRSPLRHCICASLFSHRAENVIADRLGEPAPFVDVLDQDSADCGRREFEIDQTRYFAPDRFFRDFEQICNVVTEYGLYCQPYTCVRKAELAKRKKNQRFVRNQAPADARAADRPQKFRQPPRNRSRGSFGVGVRGQDRGSVHVSPQPNWKSRGRTRIAGDVPPLLRQRIVTFARRQDVWLVLAHPALLPEKLFILVVVRVRFLTLHSLPTELRDTGEWVNKKTFFFIKKIKKRFSIASVAFNAF